MKKIKILPNGFRIILVAIICMMAFLFLTAATAEAAPQGTCGGYHYIEKGETMYSISKHYGVPIAALMNANPHVMNANRIYWGTYLFIPCAPGGPGMGGQCQAMHKVTKGETLSEIAKHYMVNPWYLAQVNGIHNLDLIYAGEVLCIP